MLWTDQEVNEAKSKPASEVPWLDEGPWYSEEAIQRRYAILRDPKVRAVADEIVKGSARDWWPEQSAAPWFSPQAGSSADRYTDPDGRCLECWGSCAPCHCTGKASTSPTSPDQANPPQDSQAHLKAILERVEAGERVMAEIHAMIRKAWGM